MKAIFKGFKELTIGAKARVIFQLLVYINQVVIFIGKFQLTDNIVYQVISLILTILITAATYWFNNDWTGFAKLSTEVYDILKDGEVTEEEVKEFIKNHSKETKKIG